MEGRVSAGDTLHLAIDAQRRERIRPQHHRHAHPALGAARGARRPREAGRLLRGGKPPALRLHALRGPRRPTRSPSWSASRTKRSWRTTPVRTYETSLASAREAGVIALFGEKYGEFRARRRLRRVLTGALWRHARGPYERDRLREDHGRDERRCESAPYRGRDELPMRSRT